MRRSPGTLSLLVTLGAGTCAQVVPPPSVVVVAAPARPARCAIPPLAALRADALAPDRYARRVLYTWTTAEQANGLRRGGALLTRSASPTHGRSMYDVVLERLAAERSPEAQLLRRPRFRRARFAWHAPWATRRGWEGEDYGEHLVRVTLRPTAWVVRMTWNGAFDATNLAGEPVPMADVLAHPERIGAVFFVQNGSPSDSTYAPAPGDDRGYHREYVLPNEPMIESWELDTATIGNDIDHALETVAAVRAWVEAGCAEETRRAAVNARGAWELTDDHGALETAWFRALAFPSSRYDLTPAALDALLAALRRTPRTGGSRIANLPGQRRRVLDPRAGQSRGPISRLWI
jgi:hypothetical protein